MANKVGFRAFAKPVSITEEYTKEYLSRLDVGDLYVFRTKTEFKFRKGSGRGDVLSLVKTKERPIPLLKIILSARDAFEGKGYPASFVRSAFYLQRNSIPAVYYLLRKKEDGSFEFAADYPSRSVDTSYEPFGRFAKRGITSGTKFPLKDRVRSEAPTSEEAPALEGPTSEESPVIRTE